MRMFLAIVGAASIGCAAIADRAPPQAFTQSQLAKVEKEFDAYYQLHGTAPPRNKLAKDGWGRELIWTQDGEDGLRVESLGRDGKEGGVGDDSDLTLRWRPISREADSDNVQPNSSSF